MIIKLLVNCLRLSQKCAKIHRWSNMANVNCGTFGRNHFYMSHPIMGFASESSKNINQQKKQIEEVMIMDESGKIIGKKKISDAYDYAKKSKLKIIEFKSDPISKLRIFKLISIGSQLKSDDDDDDDAPLKSDAQPLDADTHTRKPKDLKNYQKIAELKRVALSSRANDNDIRTKIRQIRRWCNSKCHVKVVISGNEKQSIENIFKKFNDELKGETKFMQKKMSANELKFTIYPLPDDQKQKIDDSGDVETHDVDFSKFSPNELLKDDFEELIKKK